MLRWPLFLFLATKLLVCSVGGECVESCTVPAIDNSQHVEQVGSRHCIPPGDYVNYQCLAGYTLVEGALRRQCYNYIYQFETVVSARCTCM